MKVIVDDKIPYIKEAISRLVDEVVFLPGRDFTPEAVRDADALIVRTRTRCDRALLEGSRVQFIATATIGFDHIDTAYLREAGISWTNCPGCNATSVAQYVRNALLLLQAERGWKWEELTLGIVGVGHVGSAVEQEVRRLGIQLLRCDPPRQRMEKEGDYLPLEELARRCDILTFHVPLQRSGADRTFHLADAAFVPSCRRSGSAPLTLPATQPTARPMPHAWRSTPSAATSTFRPTTTLSLLPCLSLCHPHIVMPRHACSSTTPDTTARH